MASITPRRVTPHHLAITLAAAGQLACSGASKTAPSPGRPVGGLSRAQVLAEVERAAPFIGECGVLALADDPQPIQLKYVIEPDGRARDTHVVGKPASPALARCLADRADMMRYPAFPGEAIPISMPFAPRRPRRAPAPADVAAPGQSRVGGPCDPAAVVEALPTDAIRACRAAWPGRAAETHPPFTVVWRVVPGGRAADVRIGAGVVDPKVAGCVIEAIALASYPEAAADCPVVVGYPLPTHPVAPAGS